MNHYGGTRDVDTLIGHNDVSIIHGSSDNGAIMYKLH